jgi:hypothetical protein
MFCIVTVIKNRRLEWLRHVIRMNETRSVKKILEGKLEGGRGRGRPRHRWINDVEDDLTFWHLNFILHTLYIKCKNTRPKKGKIMK